VTIEEALAWLDGHVNLETGVGFTPGRERGAPTLQRITELTTLLGTPQAEFGSVHVTGTNGKTSAARMIATLLEASELSVGLATSPHLERVNERIEWNGDPIPDHELARVLTQIRMVEEFLSEPPSYFEIMIAAAFTYFADVAVHVGVVEVGMGGTWDATNVLDAQVAVVTNVGIDHVEFLGPTRADIAADKAGIIREHATLVLGETAPELVPIFVERRPEEVWLRGRDFAVRRSLLAHGGHVVDLEVAGTTYEDVFVPLHGAHQIDNAVLALAAAQAARGVPLDDDVVHAGFAAVTSPGRLEVVGTQPLVLLDGAHNVGGAEALGRALREEFAPAPRTLVVGLLREKHPEEMLAALDAASVEHLVCTRPPSPRALDPARVADAAITLGLDEGRIDIVSDVAAAVARARDVTPADAQIVVTGSLYAVGAARAALH
jgi:dihydrofolate synthase/folylpolyglutamate synthase